MTMSSIISRFPVYLEELNQSSGKNYDTTSAGISVFLYADEFKNYLADEYNMDSSLFSRSINDLLSMEVVDGKLVDNKTNDTFSYSSESADGSESLSEEEISGQMVEILNALFENQDVIDYLDTNKSGDLCVGEISAFLNLIKGSDGNEDDISLEDIISGIEQIKNSAEGETIADLQSADDTQSLSSPAASQSAGSTPVSGSSSGSGVSSVSSLGSTTSASSKEETAEDIESQIASKNAEISKVESDAETAIAEQEEAKKAAMLEAGVSEEEYNEYKEQEEAIETQIKEKEAAISDKDNEIRDIDSTISSNENYISSLESQISSNNGKKVSSSEEGASERNAEIDRMNAALQSQIDSIKQENERLKGQKKTAEDEKTKLEADKAQLETDKQNLLTEKLNASENFGKNGSESKENLKAKIAQYDTNIQQIRADKDAKIAGLKDEIQALEVKLKDVQAKEERNKVLDENTFKSGLGLTGEELVDAAKQMLNQYGSSSGYCATGVSRTFQIAYGITLTGNGCDWIANMDNLVAEGAFVNVTDQYATSADLANLPAGAVVAWDNTGGHNGGGAQYGHVTIADGNGGEISDHYAANIYTSIGGSSTQYHVYLPVV